MKRSYKITIKIDGSSELVHEEIIKAINAVQALDALPSYMTNQPYTEITITTID